MQTYLKHHAHKEMKLTSTSNKTDKNREFIR